MSECIQLKLQVLKIHNNHNIVTLETLQSIQTLEILTIPRKRKYYYFVKDLKNITSVSDKYQNKKPAAFWEKFQDQLKVDIPKDIPKATE